jgi:hypothetical protein
VPESEQDDGGVAATVPVALGRLDQRLDLVRDEVLTGPQFGVLPRFGGTVRKISVGATTPK